MLNRTTRRLARESCNLSDCLHVTPIERIRRAHAIGALKPTSRLSKKLARICQASYALGKPTTTAAAAATIITTTRAKPNSKQPKGRNFVSGIQLGKMFSPPASTLSVVQLLLVCSVLALLEPALAQSVGQALQKLKINQDFATLPLSADLATIKLEIHDRAVKPGDQVPAKNVRDLNLAKVHWDVNGDESRYTLILLDLDRRQNNLTTGAYNQYTNFNILGNNINSGQTFVAFDPPSVPCTANSKHRILLLALLQDQNIDIVSVSDMAASSGYSPRRENFKLDEFIKRHRLRPRAANLFLATGETGGFCSSAYATLPTFSPIQLFTSSILIAMVMAASSSHRRPPVV